MHIYSTSSSPARLETTGILQVARETDAGATAIRAAPEAKSWGNSYHVKGCPGWEHALR